MLNKLFSEFCSKLFVDQPTIHKIFTIGYLLLIAATIVVFAKSILETDYQSIIKSFGIFLLLSSGIFAVWFLRCGLNIKVVFLTVILCNLLFFFLSYLYQYEVGGPASMFKIGFTYGNFWDFYYQLLLAADKSYHTIATGYLPFAWFFSQLFASIDGWTGEGPQIYASTKLLYFGVFAVSMSPFLLFWGETRRLFDNDTSILLLVLVALSYPIVFVFERGNFVILSFFFLSLALYSYWKGRKSLSVVLFSLFFSLKVTNLILMVTFIRFFGIKRWAIALVIIFVVQLVSLYYVTGGVSQWAMFAEALLAPLQGMLSVLNVTPTASGFSVPYIVTDGARLQGMTSVDTIRALFNALANDIRLNMIGITPGLNMFYNLLGLGGIIYYFINNRSPRDLNQEVIAILSLLMLAHSGSAEYNLILLYPSAIILILAGKWVSYEYGFKCLLLMTVCIWSFPIYLVKVYPDADLFNAASVKSLLIPYFLIAVFIIFSKEITNGKITADRMNRG